MAAQAPLSLGHSAMLRTGPQSDIAAIRACTRASVTDIVLAALAAALREVLPQARSRSRPLLAFVPVMSGAPDLVCSLDEHTGNRVSGFLLTLPTHERDPARRLERIVAQTSVAKRSHIATILGWGVRTALWMVPREILPRLVPLAAACVSCCGISSLRGPPAAHVGTASVRAIHFYGVFSPPRMPLMIGASSVGDRLVLSLGLTLGGATAQEVLEAVPGCLREIRRAVGAPRDEQTTDT